MASSRLERIGTIYSRVNGLLKAGVMKWEDRPIWYDVYKAFPPYDEPRYDRPEPNMPLKPIFYPEDEIRAQFHKTNKNLGIVYLSDMNSKTTTQKFIQFYENYKASSTSDDNSNGN